MLNEIPPAPRGVPQIEVTFDIDANGIVNVSATDKGTNKSQKITITSSSGLSDAEVEQMMKDAELHAEEDRKRKELVEAKNSADQLVYSTDKVIKDLGDKADASEVDKANAAKDKLKAALETDNLEEINAATEALTEIVQQLSVKLYEQAAQAEQGAEGGQGAAEGAKKDNVVDADYEVVDDEKNQG
ncbi:Chaperone protein DnaK [compost metagenome]